MSTYHITFGTYGTRLHGGEAATVALPNNRRGDPFVEFDPMLYAWRKDLMAQEPTYLTDEQRLFIESETPQLCGRGKWTYHHIGCQRDHLHFLVSAEAEPKGVRRWYKTWLTQLLNEHFGKRKWFADGGSTLYVNDEQYFNAVYQYILKQRITQR